MVTLLEYTPGDVFLSMLWFFMFFILVWLLMMVFGDIFRSDDLGGWGKALWTIFVIVLPYLGIFVYLIARGGKMGAHAAADAAKRESEMRSYVQNVAGAPSAATEIAQLAELKANGSITEAEFQQAKAKLLA